MGARGLMRLCGITTGGEFHPALSTLKPRDKPINVFVMCLGQPGATHHTGLSPIVKKKCV
jgi:hypothetical protein